MTDATAPSAMPNDAPATLPLSALLSQALVAFTIEADNETEHRLPHRTQSHGLAPGAPPGAPWLTSLLMYANCLRHLPDEGIAVAELRDRARTDTNLDGMRRWGYVTFTPDPGRGKRPRTDALIRPTPWGIAARDTWQEVTGEVESRWHDRLGAGASGALRAALADVARDLDPALPDCLPILGYGLSVTPAPGKAPRETPGRAARKGGHPAAPSDPGELPLWALLSRVLLAFATQYESAQSESAQHKSAEHESAEHKPDKHKPAKPDATQPPARPGPSLAISADILRVLTDDGVLTRDIPALGGVSKESVTMALGVLRKSALTADAPDPAGGRLRVTRLTPRGASVRDQYPARTARIELDWRARFGDGKVTALRQALEPLAAGDPPWLLAGLTPYPDNWRAQLIAPATRPQPRTTLPHYPMTLHRGGYPDGS